MDKRQKKPRRGNPNFVEGNRAGQLFAPPLLEGEKTELVSARLPSSLKARFAALPGSVSDKLRRAIELLLEESEQE